MLLTEQQLSRRRGVVFPQPERIRKVRKSMGAIRQVLGERKREKLSQLAMDRLQDDDSNMDVDDVIVEEESGEVAKVER